MLVYEHSQVIIALGAFCERTLRTGRVIRLDKCGNNEV
jgi:hypothetical protein